ncbi:MAG: DUF4364 family protein [Defluviitaleaceae bacterium]|nr:DUF4364 family protein [Defluviitaleaceae bacterium]
MQQKIYSIDSSPEHQIEQQILLLYLISKTNIPISQNQIMQFALEENYMNLLAVQEYLADMEKSGYLDAALHNNTTRYTITDGGISALAAYGKQLPIPLRNRIAKYISKNQHILKRDYEITASHFFDEDNREYIAKCGLYDGDTPLLEINTSVVSQEQALTICNNWKNNSDSIYAQIMGILFDK